jgi:TonB family protein
MREAVSDILEERAKVAAGLSRAVILSLVAHGVLLSTLILVPQFWSSAKARNEKVMVISLGGAEGPESGGRNPLSARPVQEVAPPQPRVREAPPAPKPPEMVAPEASAKPAPKTPSKPIEKPAETSSRKPTTGAEVKTGSAVAETQSTAQVPFGGLSTGGAPGTGATLDVQNFCCPGYLQTMIQMIRRNWQRNQSVAGKVTMKFVVQRDGRLTNIEVEESGGQFLDLASQRALVATRQIPPLPREFPENSLTVHLVFEYLR